MIKTRLSSFCFHRKYLSLFLLFIVNYTFYANISDTDGVLIKTDGASIKVENGAFLHIETENISQEENAKIYVVGSTIVKNISELTHAKVIYLDKKKKVHHNDVKKQDNNPTKKITKIVQRKNKVKIHFTSNSGSEIFQSFGESGCQFVIPSQVFPSAKAVLNNEITISFHYEYNANSFYFDDYNQLSSFNSNFKVRPPPVVI